MDNLLRLFNSSVKYLSSFISEEENELINDHRRQIVYNKCINHHDNQESDFYMAARNKCYDYSLTLYQLSFWIALSNGNYSSVISLDEILKSTDIGTGALCNMGSAVIIVDGIGYELGIEETKIIERNTLMPYISSFKFNPSFEINFEGCENYKAFQDEFDRHRISNNIMFGIKITGYFENVEVYKVKKTTKKLSEGLKTSILVNIPKVRGVAVGIFSPDFFEDITKKGYHLHFINEERTNGGHFVDFTNGSFKVEVQYLTNIHVVIPTYESYLKSNLDPNSMKGT